MVKAIPKIYKQTQGQAVLLWSSLNSFPSLSNYQSIQARQAVALARLKFGSKHVQGYHLSVDGKTEDP